MTLGLDCRSQYPIVAEPIPSPTDDDAGHSFDRIPAYPFAPKSDPLDIPVDDPASPDLVSSLAHDPWSAPEPGLSPAALFLSAFSPPTSHTRLPDDEGESVAGYVLGPVIGYGGFSTIRRATSPGGGGIVAIKIARRSEIDRQQNPCLTKRRLDHETHIWASLNHEHILPLFTVEHTSHADFFVMLYCPAGSLYDILKRDGNPALPLDEAGMMFRQIVRGVRYLHEVAGYVHRDIKLENILVDEMGVCRIADFGLTRKIGEVDVQEEGEPEPDVDDTAGVSRHRSTISHARHRMMTRHHQGLRRHRTSTPVGEDSRHIVHAFPAGSFPYAAPELLSPSPSARHTRAHPAHDMWALGVLLYALLTGRLPFSDSFEARLTMKILHGSFEMPQSIGRAADRVLRGCLERSMRSRWTIAMVDDVAWGIGWGGEDDGASECDEFELVNCPSRSRSRARVSYCVDDEDDRRLRPIRSSSRSRSGRSRSCISITTTTSSSLSTRSASRSISRPRVQLLSPDSGLRDLHGVRPPIDMSQSILSTGSSISGTKGSALFGNGFDDEDRGRRRGWKRTRRGEDPLGLLDDANAPVCGTMYAPTTDVESGGRPSAAVEKLRALVDAQRVGRRSGSAPPRAVPVPEMSVSLPRGRVRNRATRTEDGHVHATPPILIVPGDDVSGNRGTRRSRSVGHKRLEDV